MTALRAFDATVLLQSIPSIHGKAILLLEIRGSTLTWFEVRYEEEDKIQTVLFNLLN